MGQVFYTVNQRANLRSTAEKQRFWMTPGYAHVVMPGVVLTAYADRTDVGTSIRIENESCGSASFHHRLEYFRVIPKAFEVDEDQNTTRILVEMAFIANCSHAIH